MDGVTLHNKSNEEPSLVVNGQVVISESQLLAQVCSRVYTTFCVFKKKKYNIDINNIYAEQRYMHGHIWSIYNTCKVSAKQVNIRMSSDLQVYVYGVVASC